MYRVLKPFLPYNYLEKPVPIKWYYVVCAIYKEFCFKKRVKSLENESSDYMMAIVSFPPNNEYYFTVSKEELEENIENDVIDVDMSSLDKPNFQIFVGNKIKSNPNITLHLHLLINGEEQTLKLKKLCNMSVIYDPRSKIGWSVY